MEGPRKPRAGVSLRRLPLRQKIGALAVGIVLLMLSTGIVSILLVTRTTHTMQSILNDNQVSYNLQQAVAAESHAFRALVQTPGEETRKAYDEAAAQTARCLAAVPYDYALTGEARYEVTWTIRSSYETYCSRRDAVLAMDPAAEGYIDALYDVYAMQEYLAQYCGELTARVLQAGNDTYNAESSRVVVLPLAADRRGAGGHAWGCWPCCTLHDGRACSAGWRRLAQAARNIEQQRLFGPGPCVGERRRDGPAGPRVQQDEARHPGQPRDGGAPAPRGAGPHRPGKAVCRGAVPGAEKPAEPALSCSTPSTPSPAWPRSRARPPASR